MVSFTAQWDITLNYIHVYNKVFWLVVVSVYPHISSKGLSVIKQIGLYSSSLSRFLKTPTSHSAIPGHNEPPQVFGFILTPVWLTWISFHF